MQISEKREMTTKKRGKDLYFSGIIRTLFLPIGRNSDQGLSFRVLAGTWGEPLNKLVNYLGNYAIKSKRLTTYLSCVENKKKRN